jgi:hypothetical protein
VAARVIANAWGRETEAAPLGAAVAARAD